ncbi:8cb9c813-8ab3-4973-a628-aae03289f549 [Sclerotinia trifoliorum]|uniref:8cb9c813-8ab3-4973-a628-aae03289f549 n=1 Tax=Sclerotinia trifoliorum TaxID=28548 RepID=A0A8H2ZPB2_9HELO|nr:8cb9c813-8ab3-4973-a628-aae03289f549 [Sclerotinia trifoliorum]
MGYVEHIPQQRVWTRNLFVIFASILLFFNTILLLPWGIYHVQSFLHTDNHPISQFSSTIASLEAVDIGQLQAGGDIATVLKTAADILGSVSAQHHLASLQALSNDLHKLAGDTQQARSGSSGSNLRSRGVFEDFASAFTGGAGKKGKAAGAGGATGGGGFTGIIESLGEKVLGITADSLATPAQFLGDGVGRGVTSGLKINNGVKQTSTQKPSGINAIADNLGFGVSNALAGSLDTSSFTQGAGAASAALGTGLGGGTASGLGLNKSAVAAPNGTGIPLIIGNLGSGLTQSLFSNIDMSKIMGNLPTGMLQSAVINAGKGLGEGAAQGLNLPMNAATTMKMEMKRAAEAAAAKTNTTGSGLNIDMVAYGFTKSLSSSFLGAVDVQKLASQAMSGSNLTSMVGPVLVGAGSGLGAGAAQGLGLSNAAVAPTTGADTAGPEVAHNFAYTLTTTFLANGTLQSLQTKLMSIMSMTNISGMLGPAALGAGSGIGQGAAVGLGLQDPPTAQSSMDGGIAMTARDFSYGLTSNFLANGTVARLQAKATSLLGGGLNSSAGGLMSTLQGVSVSKAAEGLARGLVDGAGQSISTMGGFQAILNGANSTQAMMQAATPIFKTNDFNDTTGGVATSFGQGLGGQGVALIAQMLGMSMSMPGKVSEAPAPISSPDAPAGNFSSPAMRARSYRPSSIIRRTVPVAPTLPKLKLDKRVDANTNLNISDITSGLISGVNTTSLNTVLQKGVDTLTCQGVGGLVQIFSGLVAGGTIPSTFASGGTSIMLPNTVFTITNEGNEFKVNPATKDIEVNGVPLTKLVILIVAHALLLVLVYFIAIPFALLLSSGNEIATMLGRPHIWASAPKTRFYIWVFAVLPLSLGGLIFGILLLGSAPHGNTFHGIIGFITIALTFVAFILEMKFNESIKALQLMRGIVLTALLGGANVAFVTGLVDIQRISLCTVELPDMVLIGAAMNVTSSFTTGTTVVTVKMFIQKWMKREMMGVPSGSAQNMDAKFGGDVEKSGFEDEKVGFRDRIRNLAGKNDV